MKIQIILGSTRPGRVGQAVAKWALEVAQARSDAEFELVDVADYNLPLLDEPVPPLLNQYTKEHTKIWSSKIAKADGYVFVTAEYNHSVPGAFKNAVDYLNHEWHDKPLGLVSYGSAGGARAAEAWRLVAGELHLADVREQLMLDLAVDFENYSTFKPTEQHAKQLNVVLDQVIRWGGAFKDLRDTSAS
jgi:NAD(P)H-dependent FMN reductase